MFKFLLGMRYRPTRGEVERPMDWRPGDLGSGGGPDPMCVHLKSRHLSGASFPCDNGGFLDWMCSKAAF